MKNKRKVRISLFIRILFPLLLSLLLIQVITMQTVRPIMHALEAKYGIGGPGPGNGPGMGMPRPMEMHTRVASLLDEETRPETIPGMIGENKFEIRFEGPTKSWTTNPQLPDWQALTSSGELRKSFDDESVQVGRFQGKFMWAKQTDKGKVLIFSDNFGPRGPIFHTGFWIGFGIQVTMILLLCYGILVWQLRPIKFLSDGVTAVAKGDMKHEVPVTDSSELGALTSAFNGMVSQLRTIIQAKEELLLGVSHELRSPLASMEVAIEMLDDEKRKTQLRVYTRQMKTLIEELLDSHKISSEQRKLKTITMDVVPFIKNVIHLVEVPGREIQFTHPQEEPTAEFDGVRMEKVVRNLLENALKFSDYKCPVEIELIDEKDTLKIIVSDRGPGIPSEELVNIFEPFYRVEKSRSKDTGGYGLGLFLCKKIVEAHQGRIWAENRKDGGAVFTVVVPKAIAAKNAA